MRILRIVLLVSLVAALQVATSAIHPAQAASLTITPNQDVAAGSKIYVTGPPASPNASVTVNLLTVPTNQSVTITADSGGNWSAIVTVPSNTSQNTTTGYQVNATSGTTQLGTGSITVVSGFTLTVSPNPTTPNSSVTVSGTGFTTYANQTVFVQVGSQSGGVAASVSSSGTFSANVGIPGNTQNGYYAVTVTANNGATTVATSLLQVANSTASITLQPSSVTAGPSASTVVSGTGFQPNNNITINYTATAIGGGTVTPSTTAVVTSAGTFTATLPVPANVANGQWTVTAKSQNNSDTATAILNVTASTPPAITVSPALATGGTLVTISGTNFSPGPTITISATVPVAGGLNVPLSTTATAGTNGTFNAQLTVPINASSGVVTVTASQTVNNANVSATTQLSITALRATITVSVNSAKPGDTLTITGSGFTPNSTVTISSDNNWVTGTASTDGVGNFTAHPVVSSAATTAAITITARDGSGISATTVLVINAPVQPTPTPSPTPTPTPTLITSVQPSFAHAVIEHKKIKEGKHDTVTIQGEPGTTLKVRLQVLFPSGQHIKVTDSTDSTGAWSHMFLVPSNAINSHSHTAYVLLQLWNGTLSRKDFLPLTLTK